MTHLPDTQDRIHYIQRAIWKLEDAAQLVEDASGDRDPNALKIRDAITLLNIDLDDLSNPQ